MNHIQKLCAIGAAMALTACGGGSDTAVATPQNVTIQFAAVAGSGNAPVACSTTAAIASLGNSGVSAQLTDLRFYVTDVQLITDTGVAVPVTLARNDWQYTSGADSVTLIDLENGVGTCAGEGTAATNAVIAGTVPAGTYVKVKATIGVPERLSHSDVMAAAAPLDIMAMGWSWQAGRKFMKIEVNPTGGVTTTTGNVSTYNLHLASTDCSGPGDGTDTCAKKNLTQLTFDFNPASQQIALDLATLFGSNNIAADTSGAVGCMSATSDTECTAIFGKVGLDMATGAQALTAQSVFRPIAK